MIYLIIIVMSGLAGFIFGKMSYTPTDYCKVEYSPSTTSGLMLAILVMIIVGGISWVVHVIHYSHKNGLL